MARTPVFWRKRGLAALGLLPLAALFGLVVGVRRWLYRRGMLASVQVGVPVVVVGNLVAGGGGKTPLIVALVAALQQRGFRPGVVSRGYGGGAGGALEVLPDSAAAVVGDEPLLIRRKTGAPVAVGRDRVAAARCLLASHPGIDLILADDGLQHYRLVRALELCVVAAGQGLGNGWLLPAGPLREPRSRLASVDAVLRAGEASVAGSARQWGMRRRLGQAWRLRAPDERAELVALPRVRWLAACGIARPEDYFVALAEAGLAFERRAFPDHHAFAATDLPGDGAVLMTEKDAVKCLHFAGPDWWAVELVADPEPAFVDWLAGRLGHSLLRRPGDV